MRLPANTPSLAIILLFAATRVCAGAIGEIQVYDDGIDEPKSFGLESHLNTTVEGRAAPAYPGEIVPHRGIQFVPEISYGLTRTLEPGIMLPLERTGAGAFDSAGVKLRLRWLPIQPDDKKGGWFAAGNGELSRLARRFDETRWSFELRTITGYRSPDWLITMNTDFSWALAGSERQTRPDGAQFFKAAREIVKGVSLGPEYYADFGRLGRPREFAEQDHTLYAAFDVDLKPWIFNAGIGRGG